MQHVVHAAPVWPAKAVVDEKMVGKVYVTGLGLPSEMAGHVKSGAVKEFAIWNPIDLGYAVEVLARLVNATDAAALAGVQ